jgi:glucose-6-phosphate isomerase
VKDALSEEEMPNITMTLTELNYRAAGELLAFLQYLAVYSAELRGVDPYSQPDVENSKKIGFEERFRR